MEQLITPRQKYNTNQYSSVKSKVDNWATQTLPTKTQTHHDSMKEQRKHTGKNKKYRHSITSNFSEAMIKRAELDLS